MSCSAPGIPANACASFFSRRRWVLRDLRSRRIWARVVTRLLSGLESTTMVAAYSTRLRRGLGCSTRARPMYLAPKSIARVVSMMPRISSDGACSGGSANAASRLSEGACDTKLENRTALHSVGCKGSRNAKLQAQRNLHLQCKQLQRPMKSDVV